MSFLLSSQVGHGQLAESRYNRPRAECVSSLHFLFSPLLKFLVTRSRSYQACTRR
jgi:hypothetical protein